MSVGVLFFRLLENLIGDSYISKCWERSTGKNYRPPLASGLEFDLQDTVD